MAYQRLLSDSPIIAVVGSVTNDIVLETDQIPKPGQSIVGNSLQMMAGGKGANIAIAVYRASHKKPLTSATIHEVSKFKSAATDTSELPPQEEEIRVFMNGAVGDDHYGATLKEALQDQDIDVTGLRTLPGEQTGQVIVMVHQATRESCSLGFKGANGRFRLGNDETISCLAGNRGEKPDLVITNCMPPMETVERVLQMASDAGVETVLSASPVVQLPERILGHVTHLILNQHEAAFFSSRSASAFKDIDVAVQTAEDFVQRGVKYAVITLGADGAVWATRDDWAGNTCVDTPNAIVKDTTGAGDSFLGAYAVHYTMQKQQEGGIFNIEEAVTFACKAASKTISRLGAQTALPWADEIGMR